VHVPLALMESFTAARQFAATGSGNQSGRVLLLPCTRGTSVVLLSCTGGASVVLPVPVETEVVAMLLACDEFTDGTSARTARLPRIAPA